MNERWVQVKKFLHEAWWELFRWTLAFWLASSGVSTALLWWKFGSYPFLVYFGCFWGSLAAAWILMFRRKALPDEFKGDD
jgi:hypothetical protein